MGQTNLNRTLRGGIGRVIRAGTLAVPVLLALGASGMAAAAASDYLSDQPELILASKQDWGALGFNVAVGGAPLQIGTKHFDKGLGHHANGVITLLPDGQYESFDAELGLQRAPVSVP